MHSGDPQLGLQLERHAQLQKGKKSSFSPRVYVIVRFSKKYDLFNAMEPARNAKAVSGSNIKMDCSNFSLSCISEEGERNLKQLNFAKCYKIFEQSSQTLRPFFPMKLLPFFGIILYLYFKTTFLE